MGEVGNGNKKFKKRNEIAIGLLDWDLKVEQSNISEDDHVKRDELLFESFHLDHLERMDLAQKACVKWAVEGDEKSVFSTVW